MQELDQHIKAFSLLGESLRTLTEDSDSATTDTGFLDMIQKAKAENPWFDESNTKHALNAIGNLLTSESLNEWAKDYIISSKARTIGVIMPGNIPAAGFHDLLCVVFSGNRLKAKMSRDDSVILPYIKSFLTNVDEKYNELILFEDNLKDIDAVIATGSNNTFRYFDYYFSKYPHIFRKNRNSVAVITGNENEFDFLLLSKDIFRYYGLGCRNVSKLFVPEDYNFDMMFHYITSAADVMQHSKYMNNYDYQRTLLLMNNIPFLTNNFLIVKEDPSLSSPVSVLHYEKYSDVLQLESLLEQNPNDIQCIVSKTEGPDWVSPGHAQLPTLGDYADNIDTMKFLTTL